MVSLDKIFKSKQTFLLEDFDEHQKTIIIYEEAEVDIIKKQHFDDGYQNGLKDGYEQGRDEALTENDILTQNILMKLEKKIDDILTSQTQYYQTVEDNVKILFFAFAQKLLPHYIAQYGISEMQSFVEKVLNTLLRKEHLKIFLAPSMMENFKEHLLSNGFNIESFSFEEKKDLEKEQINIEWHHGGANFDLNSVYKLINTLLENNFKTATQNQIIEENSYGR
ncbi:MAG: hypothetical protein HEEMFOPI_00162 [Holosporales bacterium]